MIARTQAEHRKYCRYASQRTRTRAISRTPPPPTCIQAQAPNAHLAMFTASTTFAYNHVRTFAGGVSHSCMCSTCHFQPHLFNQCTCTHNVNISMYALLQACVPVGYGELEPMHFRHICVCSRFFLGQVRGWCRVCGRGHSDAATETQGASVAEHVHTD